VVALLLVLLWTPVQVAADDSAREYTFSSDPSVAVVTITSSGGGTSGRSEYKLFGDGRLAYRPRHPQESAQEATLTYAEMDDIVRTLVDGGLMDWERENVFRRLREAGAAGGWTDSSTVRIRIVLDHYQDAEGREAASTKEFSYDLSPALIKFYSPQALLPEIEALLALKEKMKGHLAKGREAK